ncbi:MAG TPA: AmmeMemoRadiSam system protein B [Bacteroidota bacterium]|nr:AmmeMemoRadiSam system protein B [Bacteroidota bacterium]
MTPRIFLRLLLPLVLAVSACSGQKPAVDRPPAVAGAFYPASRTELLTTLDDLFARAVHPGIMHDVAAVIVPHAGYVYSGVVAASGFSVIDTTRTYENVFIIGPSHTVGFEGASVYTAGDYQTPLGSAEVNRQLGEELIRRSRLFSNRNDAHATEHSVEVQVPFLQHMFGSRLRIVPIVVGANAPETCRMIAEELRPYLNGRNLFVISSDFSHYPAYDDAVRVDRATADAILTNSPDNLIATMERNDRSGTPNLATSLCGWSAVLTLLYMTAGSTGHRYTKIQYKNSGDSPAGEKDRVVGYNAIAVTREPQAPPKGSFLISPEERTSLLAIARRTVESYVSHGTVPDVDEASLSPALRTKCGAFVTLNEHEQLRGCIGRFDAAEPLYRVVQQMAVAAATQDYRFSPVQASEVASLQIEISVLTPMRKIASIDEFQLGRDGIYMKKGSRSGTFLPQVAQETGWSRDEFLGHCAQDKAGIGWDGWKDAELYVYEAIVFGEPES